jgi:hypothetical protein
MRHTHAVCLLAAVAYLGAACHKLTPLDQDDILAREPSRIWITHVDNSLVMTEVSGPRIFNDTLVGYMNGEFSEIPVSELKSMVIREPARGRTILLAAAGTVGVAGLVWLVSGGGNSDNKRFYFDCDDDPELPECTMN